MPKSFQAPFALLEVDILHVLGPSSSLLWFQHVCACSIYFRLKKCLQSAALCNRVLARSRKNASRNSHATKSKEHSTVSTWRPSEQVIQLGVKCVTHTLSRSLPTLSMNSMNKLDGPLPLQISWISASLLVVHSVGLEPIHGKVIPWFFGASVGFFSSMSAAFRLKCTLVYLLLGSRNYHLSVGHKNQSPKEACSHFNWRKNTMIDSKRIKNRPSCSKASLVQ